MINIDKNKDIDGYVNKLTDMINNKIKLERTINIRINSIMCDINNISNMVNKNMDKASNMDNDTLHLIDDILNKFIKYLIMKKFIKSKKRLKTVSVYQINCHKILKDFFPKDMDKIIPKIEHKDMLHKKNKKIGPINKLNKVLSEVYTKVTNKVKSIYESKCELKDEIYNDPWLRLVELNKIKDILDDALNIVSKEIYGKNRISSKIIDIDKNKDIDGYVSKLTDVINNYIKLINKIGETLDHIICEINNETSTIDEIIYKVSVMDNDTLHLINDKLNEIITQARKKLKK